MNGLALTREIGAVVGAIGIVGLMAPIPGTRRLAIRCTGLLLVIASWCILAASLAPASIGHRLHHLIARPVGIAELVVIAIVGLVCAAAVLGIGAWGVQRWPVAWLIAMVIAIPLRIPIPVGGTSRNLLVPLYLLAAWGLVAYLWTRVRGASSEDDPSTPLDLPISVFLAFTLISVLWTSDTKDAAIQIVFFYLPFPLLFYTVIAWWRRIPHAIGIGTAVTIGFASAISILALVQYTTRWIFWNSKLQEADVYSQFFRVNGIFYDPNIMGRYLAIAVVAAVAWMWLRPSTRMLIIGTAAIVLLLGGLMVSFSRSSCLLVMVAMLLLAWRAFGARRSLAVGGIAFVILAAGAIAGSHNIRASLTSTHHLSTVSEGRFGLMSGGLHIWEQAPIVGSGVGSFQAKFTATETANQIAHKQVSISHNAPITVLAELGLIGMALFLWLCVATWRSIAQASRRAPIAIGWMQWSLLALIVGIFIHSQLYADLFEDPMLWVIAAAAVSLRLPSPLGTPSLDPSAAEG